jgi:hypothetical protein
MKWITTFAILVAFAAPAAHAEDFTFSFSGGGGSPGLVTGELIGLSPDGTSSPTDVLLLSNTDGVRNGDLSAMGWFNYAGTPNSFTVTDGAITAENFTLFSANTDDFFSLGLHFDGVAFNLLDNALTDEQTGNASDVAGVTFTPVAVPEPACIVIFLAGLATLAFLQKRASPFLRWRRAPAASGTS